MNTVPLPRPQSAAEEIANSLSHGIAFLLSAAALPLLLQVSTARGGQPLQAWAMAVFAASMMLLYLSSALFHGLPEGAAKRRFDRLDRAAIYLFIAGSYTPFAVTALQGALAWSLFALVWVLAAIGAVLSLKQRSPRPLLSTALYVAMGWLVLLAALPWMAHLQAAARQLLLAGGIAYTLGAVLFLLSARLRYAHLAWHLMVMAGSGLHFAAVWHHA